MSLFKSKNTSIHTNTKSENNSTNGMADLALNSIADGVLLVGVDNKIQFANPAAATLTGYSSPHDLIGLGYQFVMTLEDADGKVVPPELSKLTAAMRSNSAMTTREYLLVAAQSERRVAISLAVTPTGGPDAARIITFRDITKELEEEDNQSEFISTASHEMRTPVASIEGYLGLALNPQTATIDDRARKYLEAAHAASQHLGHLFKDLLDVTKLDDGRQKVHLVPVDIVSKVREIADERAYDMQAKNLRYSFGAASTVQDARKVEPLVYAAVDLDFLREILDNLIDNSIKYTPEGGEIWVDVRADGDKVLISVADNGIGIAADDLGHIFQKFYRADNSQTRSIGGTGLGLYLVKQRVEAMNGRVWAESVFGSGSSFFVSLPRLSSREYEKRRIAYENEQAAEALSAQQAAAQNTNQVPWPGNNTTNGTVSNASVAPTPASQMTGAHVASLAGALTGASPVNVTAAAPPTTPAQNINPAAAVANTQNATTSAPETTATPAPAMPAANTQNTTVVTPAPQAPASAPAASPAPVPVNSTVAPVPPAPSTAASNVTPVKPSSATPPSANVTPAGSTAAASSPIPNANHPSLSVTNNNPNEESV